MKLGFTALAALALLGITAAQAQTINQAEALEAFMQNNAREEATVAHDHRLWLGRAPLALSAAECTHEPQ